MKFELRSARFDVRHFPLVGTGKMAARPLGRPNG